MKKRKCIITVFTVCCMVVLGSINANAEEHNVSYIDISQQQNQFMKNIQPIDTPPDRRITDETSSIDICDVLGIEKTVKIETSVSSPQIIDTEVTFTAQNVFDYSSTKYIFWINDGSGWKIQVPTENNNSIKITSSKVGKVKVWVDVVNLIRSNKIESSKMVEFEFKEKPYELKIVDPNLQFNSLVSINNPDTIVLHHAGASKYSVYQVHDLHLRNGWEGIGYHYYVAKDGIVYRGRPETSRGSHSPAKNTSSIGICAEGNYVTETMPEAQKKAIIELCKNIKERYNITYIGGHEEFTQTDCPGTKYPMKEIINAVN